MADNAASPPLPSRYKSQRRKQPSVDDARASDQRVSSPADDGVTRSKSRYHHKRGNSSGSPSNPHGSVPKQPSDSPSRYHSTASKPLYREQIVQAPRTVPRPTIKDDGYGSPPAKPTMREPKSYTSNQPSSDGLRQQYRSRENQQTRNGESRSRSNVPSPPIPTSMPAGELFPPPRPVEQKTFKDGPPQSSNIRATKSMSHLPVFDGDEDVGCFGGLFKRKKSDTQAMEEINEAPLPLTMSNGERPAIMAGGGGVVPGTDAPVSAINVGDRHVLVECGKSHALFPFTPTTTPADIIKSAATCLSERINVKSAVLLENFSTVGIQRPLRRYEHIRDVMNSWDHDKQNSLILINPGTGSLEPELTLAGAPKFEPAEQSWSLLYSQKVGKWDKKVVIVRSNGQVVCHKDSDKPKDAVNICHLSDFDIYAPTPEKLKKKIKPPKRYCLAIKSQQKTSLFESTENFVHFFATADRQTSDDFYNAVQAWRSWYLVNIMGEGKKEKERPVVKTVELRNQSANTDTSKHRPQESIDSHYQLGSFKPLIDTVQFHNRPTGPGADNGPPTSSGGFTKSANQFDVNVSPERRTSTRKRQQHPPVSLNNRAQLAEDEPLANLARTGSVNKGRSSADQQRPVPSEFKDSSLLGRQYSQRRKETAERETQRQDAFTAGPSLLNRGTEPGQTLAGDGLRRQPSTRAQTSNGEMARTKSTRERPVHRGGSVELERSASRRQKPKPLIDLTPQYREPPQHSKKGRGFNPTSVGAGGLIANATSPEDPLGLPQNHVFRSTTSGQHPGNGLVDVSPQHREAVQHTKKERSYQGGESGLVGNATSVDNNPSYRSTNSGSADASDAFTGEGLLAASSNRQGWGGSSKGRGVSGGGNGKPLVDFSADGKFVQGSLLGNVEKKDGIIPAPVVDRGRGE